MFDEYFYFGVITKIFGYKGDVDIYIDSDEPYKYKNLELVYIDIDGKPIPFFIDKLEFKNNNHAIVHFQDISLEDAERLVKHDLYLPLTMLPKLEGNKFYYHEVKGYTVIDETRGELGIITDILEYPSQAVFQIDYNGIEILIPIVDPVIVEVNRTQRQIRIKAPDELIDLYLQQ